jgi:vacuolar protein sorting-associated protein 13A/C
MIEGLVTALLSRFLGDFVNGLEKENLRIGILSGDVTLENLELKKEALQNFDLPITIKTGFLGRLHLSIPWQNLGSRPAIIRLERIYLVAGPTKVGEDSIEIIEKREQNTKQKRLMLYELLNKPTDDDAASKTAAADEGDTFTKRWLTKVVDNLQLFVDKVHIRYEDDRTNPGVCRSCH